MARPRNPGSGCSYSITWKENHFALLIELARERSLVFTWRLHGEASSLSSLGHFLSSKSTTTLHWGGPPFLHPISRDSLLPPGIASTLRIAATLAGNSTALLRRKRSNPDTLYSISGLCFSNAHYTLARSPFNSTFIRVLGQGSYGLGIYRFPA